MYNPDYYDWNTPTGWRCPVCGKIWAPHISSCYYCNAERKTFTTTETIKIDDAEWWENFVKILAPIVILILVKIKQQVGIVQYLKMNSHGVIG